MHISKFCLSLAIALIISACESNSSNRNIVEVEMLGLHGDVAIQIADEEPQVISREHSGSTVSLTTRANELTEDSITVTSHPEGQLCLVRSAATDLSQFPAKLGLTCVAFSEIPEGVSEVAVMRGSTCAIIHDRLHCWGLTYRDDWHHGVEYSNPRLLVNSNRLYHNRHCLIDDTGLHCNTIEGLSLGFDTEALSEQFDDVRELALSPYGDDLCFIDNNGLQCASSATGGSGGLAELLAENAPELTDPHSLTLTERSLCVVDQGKPICWGYDHTPLDHLNDIQHIKIGSSFSGCANSLDTMHFWGLFEEVPEDLGLVTDFALNSQYVCALTLDGTRCWGYPRYVIDAIYTLGYPDTLALAEYHGCVIREERLSCFGSNYHSLGILMPVLP